MRRTGYLGTSLLLVLALAATALPGFSQAAPAAPAKGPQAKTQAEYNAYTALYNEKNPQKKAELGEKFLTDFKETDFVSNTYTMIIGAYTGAQNWQKVIDAAERAVAFPGADNRLKAFAYANAMVASQNLNQIDKVIAYGDKVLAIDPNDLNTMITLSAIIPAKLPGDDAGKKAALDKAEGLAKKALTGVDPLLAQAPAAQKPQIVQIQSQRHSGRHRRSRCSGREKRTDEALAGEERQPGWNGRVHRTEEAANRTVVEGAHTLIPQFRN